MTLNAGAIIGAVGGGWLADRFHIKWVLFSMYVLAAISITLLGVKMPTAALFVVVALAGASTIGTQIVTYAYAGQFYPMAIRSTGIGFASGVGRSGAILAPIVIGTLVGMALPLQHELHRDRDSCSDRRRGGGDDQPRPLSVGAPRGRKRGAPRARRHRGWPAHKSRHAH